MPTGIPVKTSTAIPVRSFKAGEEYTITSTLSVISEPCIFELGSTVRPAAGVTVEFSGPIHAALIDLPIFDLQDSAPSAGAARVKITNSDPVCANWWSGRWNGTNHLTDAGARISECIENAQSSRLIRVIGELDIEEGINATDHHGTSTRGQRIPYDRVYDFSGSYLQVKADIPGAILDMTGSRRCTIRNLYVGQETDDTYKCDVGILLSRNEGNLRANKRPKSAGEHRFEFCTVAIRAKVAAYYVYSAEGVDAYSCKFSNAHPGGAAAILTKWNDSDSSTGKKGWDVASQFQTLATDETSYTCNNQTLMSCRLFAIKEDPAKPNSNDWPNSDGVGLFIFHASRIHVKGGFMKTSGRAAVYVDQTRSGSMNGLWLEGIHSEGNGGSKYDATVYVKGTKKILNSHIYACSTNPGNGNDIEVEALQGQGVELWGTNGIKAVGAARSVYDVSAMQVVGCGADPDGTATDTIDLSGLNEVRGLVQVPAGVTFIPAEVMKRSIIQNDEEVRVYGNLMVSDNGWIGLDKMAPPGVPGTSGHGYMYLNKDDESIRIHVRRNSAPNGHKEYALGTYNSSPLVKTASWAPTFNAGTTVSTTVPVTNADLEDECVATHDKLGSEDVLISAHVESSNTVRVVMTNKGPNDIDLTGGTVSVKVLNTEP